VGGEVYIGNFTFTDAATRNFNHVITLTTDQFNTISAFNNPTLTTTSTNIGNSSTSEFSPAALISTSSGNDITISSQNPSGEYLMHNWHTAVLELTIEADNADITIDELRINNFGINNFSDISTIELYKNGNVIDDPIYGSIHSIIDSGSGTLLQSTFEQGSEGNRTPHLLLDIREANGNPFTIEQGEIVNIAVLVHLAPGNANHTHRFEINPQDIIYQTTGTLDIQSIISETLAITMI